MRLSPSVRARTGQALALLILGCALGAAIHAAPGQFRDRDADRTAYAELSDAQRLLIPARAYDVDTDVFEKAAAVIPRTTSFAFAAGPGTYHSSELVLAEASTFAHFFLLPRRRVAAADAGWVVSYGATPSTFGVTLGEPIVTAEGRFIAPVVRP